MASVDLQVIETVLAFGSVVLLGVLLKKLSIIRESDAPLFARLLTQAVMPAVIFTQLATHPVSSRQFLLVVAMLVTGSICLVFAFLIGTLMRLDRPKIGALMLTSSFGSSALLGYPLIKFAFPDNPEAMTDAILLSELGVGLPIFILGPAVAMYFGSSGNAPSVKKVALAYFRSPIFIAVILGLTTARFHPDFSRPVLAPIFQALRMIDGSLAVIACLVLALQLKLKSLRGLLPLFLISSLLQMGLQPCLAHVQAVIYGLVGAEQRQVLILISSLPSAVLGPVFATRYDCAGDTASALVMSHIIAGVVIVPVCFSLLG